MYIYYCGELASHPAVPAFFRLQEEKAVLYAKKVGTAGYEASGESKLFIDTVVTQLSFKTENLKSITSYTGC